MTEAAVIGFDLPTDEDLPFIPGLSLTDTRRVGKLRAAEIRYLRDGLEAARIFNEAGRPAAVDRFIGQCLAAARRARRLARALEERAGAS